VALCGTIKKAKNNKIINLDENGCGTMWHYQKSKKHKKLKI
jgi:hypothetical protein